MSKTTPEQFLGWEIEVTKGLSYIKHGDFYIMRVWQDYEWCAAMKFRWEIKPKENFQAQNEIYRYRLVCDRPLPLEDAIKACEDNHLWISQLK